MGVLHGPRGSNHGVHEHRVIREPLKIEVVNPPAQFLNALGELGEPLLAALLQAPTRAVTKVTASAAPTTGTDPTAASPIRSTISRAVPLPGGVVSIPAGYDSNGTECARRAVA